MNAVNEIKEYDARLDAKKRLTVRGARTRYYHVTEYEDGTVTMSPRTLIHPDEISRRTLDMMDKVVQNMDKGEVSKPVDMQELEKLIEE